MKKIMFNDEFLLTQAVLEGRKTQTRRIVSQSLIDKYEEWYDDVCSIAMPSGSTIETLRGWLLRKHTRYRAGEVVAVAQSYRDCGGINEYGVPMWEIISQRVGGTNAGWDNKMFLIPICRHLEQVWEVYAGGMATTFTPASLPLYSRKLRSWAKGQELARHLNVLLRFSLLARLRILVKSSTDIPLFSRFACSTICLLIVWLTMVANLRSRPRSRFSSLCALRVPLA